jgi:CRISPR-associated protein Cas4
VHRILIHASHFGSWTYCRKQYHLAHVLGRKPDAEVQKRLEAGHRAHHAHGQRMDAAARAKRLMTVFTIGALLLLGWLILSGATRPTAFDVSSRRTIVLLALGFAAVALLLRTLSLALQQSTGLPGVAEIIASDTRQRREKLFRNRKVGLVGKPDYLRWERCGGWFRSAVAAEVKPDRVRDEPYDGDRLQLLAYVVLTAAHYGRRAARFGYLAYANRTWKVELDAAATERVLRTADAMRAAHALPVLPRDHRSTRRCERCGFRRQCSDSLAA